ncbi:hypothetical protein [Neptunomonas antarctica]|uniref:hypothetical protein n=1 Tax=Neptunomonas antarctica TaxID=619304 RepID=UPI0006C7EAE3|nr:hypothetical protein [Neptunomonas antarctica]
MKYTKSLLFTSMIVAASSAQAMPWLNAELNNQSIYADVYVTVGANATLGEDGCKNGAATTYNNLASSSSSISSSSNRTCNSLVIRFRPSWHS